MANQSLHPPPEEKRSSRLWLSLGLALIFIFGLSLAVRLFDLTDQPIDFHPTRQLRGAIIARGIFYNLSPSPDPDIKALAASFQDSTGKYEPPLLEGLVALVYLVIGQELLWISRIITTLFWILGGGVLFILSLRMSRSSLQTQDMPGSDFIVYGCALTITAYFLLLPFGVQASRSFQPDPGMVMWIIFTIFSLYRWSETPGWKWAILAGLFGGMAILTKAVAVYPIAGAAIALVIYTYGFKKAVREFQVWCMALLMLLPTVVFYASKSDRAAEYFSSWTVTLSHLLVQPSFYVRWLSLVSSLMGLAVLLLALLGVGLSRGRNRVMLLGLWIGYFLYGLFYPYQMYTHNYYHLGLIPIIALSLLPVIEIILLKIQELTYFWKAVSLIGTIAILLFVSWESIFPQYAEDHRDEPIFWQEIASQLPTDGKIIGLTQDYGYRLMYYGWRKVSLWPNRGEFNLMDLRGDEKEFEEFFAKKTDGKSYFLVTSFNQFNNQPILEEYLNQHFPLLAESSSYLIYDLREKPH
jgi:4-amino-4-deoxy-L-arabinose transferase-like glycosyltransferase